MRECVYSLHNLADLLRPVGRGAQGKAVGGKGAGGGEGGEGMAAAAATDVEFILMAKPGANTAEM